MNRDGRKPVAGDSAKRLDVRWMKRQGYLRPMWASSLHWSVTEHGRRREVGSIGFQTDEGVDGRPCSLTLHYWAGPDHDRCEVREPVAIEWMPVHLGGARPWFRCPCCAKRVAVLWGGRRFLCRSCNRVAYPVQNEGKQDRLERKAMKLRERLGAFTDRDFSIRDMERRSKPKWMRWRTFERLRARAVQAEREWHAAEVNRWGAWALDFFPVDRVAAGLQK